MSGGRARAAVAKRCGARLLIGLALGAPPQARAQEAETGRRPVSLDLDPCLGDTAAEARRIARLELDARPGDDTDPGARRVHATCRGSRIALELFDPLTGASASRELSLEATADDARARLLALAIAELVAACDPAPPSRSDAAPPAVPAAAPTPPSASPPAPTSSAPTSPSPSERELGAKAETRPWRIDAFAQGRALLSPGLTSVGFGAGIARVGRAEGASLGWGVGVLADEGSKGTPLGRVSVSSISVAPSLLVACAWGPVALDAGLGVRVGAARLAGEPNAQARGHVLVSAWGGPLARAGARVAVTPYLAVELGAEIGEAPFPARARVAGGGDVSVVGVWLGAHGGAAVSF